MSVIKNKPEHLSLASLSGLIFESKAGGSLILAPERYSSFVGSGLASKHYTMPERTNTLAY